LFNGGQRWGESCSGGGRGIYGKKSPVFGQTADHISIGGESVMQGEKRSPPPPQTNKPNPPPSRLRLWLVEPRPPTWDPASDIPMEKKWEELP